MIGFFARITATVLVLTVTAWLSYTEGRRVKMAEVMAIDREMSVLDYRIGSLVKGYAKCVDLMEFYKDSAIAANRALVVTEPDWDDDVAIGGGND